MAPAALSGSSRAMPASFLGHGVAAAGFLLLALIAAFAQDGAGEPPADSPLAIRERALEALETGDLPTAARMLRELGDSGVAQGYTMLGEIKRDLGDNADAARWFERGAEGGDVLAMLQGGEILSDPKFAIKDARRAYRLWQSAAERGAARGQFEAGRALMTGAGVRADDKVGADWIEKAARQCHPDAQLSYALVLREGRGREANGELAFAWVIAAQRSSDSWSKENLERIATLEREIPAYMSSEQVTRSYCTGLDLLAESCGSSGILFAIERWLACRG